VPATAEITRRKEILQQALHDWNATQSQLIQLREMLPIGELTRSLTRNQQPVNFITHFFRGQSGTRGDMAGELTKEILRKRINSRRY